MFTDIGFGLGFIAGIVATIWTLSVSELVILWREGRR